MSIKLNGSNSGSVEIDVPADAGLNTAITFPATSGEVIVSDTSGVVNVQGDLLVGTATDSVYSDDGVVIGSDGSSVCKIDGTYATAFFDFRRGGSGSYTQVGAIYSLNGTTTMYSTSSDYRLKENVVPLTDAANRLKQLHVHRFNFIADPETTVDGFLAHEAQAVVPECVTGTKDEVDADGNPIYQGIDQSKLVPLLTAALQEAIQKIETQAGVITALDARLTALEGGAS